MSFVDEEDLFELIDPLLQEVLALGGIEVRLRSSSLGYDEAMLRYGSDRPDRAASAWRSHLTDVSATRSSRSSAARSTPGAWCGGADGPRRLPRSRIDKLE